MRRITALILLVCLFLTIISGCGREPAVDQNNTKPSIPVVSYPTNLPDDEFAKTMVAVSVPTTTKTTYAKDGGVLFLYTYQRISLILHRPEVADRIIADFLQRVDSTRQAAEDTEAAAREAYTGAEYWIPYQCHVAYSPMRIDHKVLSFFGNYFLYTGASHAVHTCVSVSYDMATGDTLTLESILAAGKKTEALKALVLEDLAKKAEGDYLYEDYTDAVNERFNLDPSTDEDWYFTQTGLCFYFEPYEIAPYSSGVVTVEIPFEKLTDLIRKDYLPDIRKETKGSVVISPFKDVNLEQFSNIAEYITDEKGSMYMVYTEGHVQDLRINTTDQAGTYTVFAIYNLSSTDGIMIQTTEETLAKLSIRYKSGSETLSHPLVR